MKDSYDFLQLVLNALPEQVVVINQQGEICFVNRSWQSFGAQNGCTIDGSWVGYNYLRVCDEAEDELWAKQAASGIRSVIEHGQSEFYLEYPCHSPTEKHWFMMRATQFRFEEKCYAVISHQKITERKLAEEKVIELSLQDELTCIPNRRAFDRFLSAEWHRCERFHKPLCLALIDVDLFKQINDSYGHQFGDVCLVKLATLLNKCVKRPGDICARYGGDEFVVVWGDTEIEDASKLLDKLMVDIDKIELQHPSSNAGVKFSVSIGLAATIPDQFTDFVELVSAADELLYKAKDGGRNSMVSSYIFSQEIRISS